MSGNPPSPRHEPFYHRFGLVSPFKSEIGSGDGSVDADSNSAALERLQDSDETQDETEDTLASPSYMASCTEEDTGHSCPLSREHSSQDRSHPLLPQQVAVGLESDDADLVEKCPTEELSMIETAILRVLQKENPQLAKRDSGIEAALAGGQGGQELSQAVMHDGQRSSALLLGLLQEVRSLRSERKHRQTEASQSGTNYSMQLQASADRYVKPEQEALVAQPEQTLKEVVEAAARAAVAAAEAAQSAAVSVKENTAAMESLAKSLSGGPSTPIVQGGSDHLEVSGSTHPDVEKESESNASGDPKIVELAKVVRKQNRLTHLLLGFMLVTTAVWRFKTLSVVMKLQKKIANPGEVFQSIFSGDNKDEASMAQKLPGLQEVATLLQGDPETGKPGLLSGLIHDDNDLPVRHKPDSIFL